MSKKQKIIYGAAGVVIALIIGAISVLYIVWMNNTIKNNTLSTIHEMAEHDNNAINAYVENNWKSLDRIGERLERRLSSNDRSTVFDAQLFLMEEWNDCKESDRAGDDVDRVGHFDRLYVMTANGDLYSHTFNRYVAADYPLKQYFGSDSNEMILRYDIDSKESVVYGVRVDGAGTERVGVYALIGVSDISSVRTNMVINSFLKNPSDPETARGHSAVVNVDGGYIVDFQNISDVNQSRNLFSWIDSSKKSDLKGAEIKKKMVANETFSFYYTYLNDRGDSVKEFLYCTPFSSDRIDWYFILAVDNEAFSEQTNEFMGMSVTVLAVVVVVVIVALSIVMITHSRTVKAMAKERAQGEFLSNMSHEIRTPLNGLIGLNHLVMQSVDDPSRKEQVKEWLAKSHGTANYLLSLINDVLDMSKLQAGKVQILREPVLLETVADAIWSMQRDNIESRGVKFITEVNITEPCVLGDEVRLKQVLMNIVGNAAKFTPEGGYIKFTVNQLKTDEKHVTTVFVCEDTGCGMTQEFLTTIFDAFAQERNRNSDSIKGTGLGMAISKLLVDGMGGTIDVKSELDKGSVFTVAIPAEISTVPEYMKQSPEEMQAAAQLKAGNEAGASLKILVAEDNELNAEILLEILEDAGFEAVHAQNGKEAVEIFTASAAGEYGIILMDMRMPVMDGCAAAKAIRQSDHPDARAIPIFACTANSFEEDRNRAMLSGMNDFLTKPINIKVFLQKMEAVSKNRYAGKMNLTDGDGE